MNDAAFRLFCESYMFKSGRPVAGRFQAALALLERLRSYPTFGLADHTVEGGASVVSHETFAKAAIARFGLTAVNKNGGRRSSNLPKWGQPLLNAVRDAGYSESNIDPLQAIQARFADRIRAILETDPFEVRLDGRSAETVISDVLEQAGQRDRIGAVAQYLVAAKLQLRFPQVPIPIQTFNQHDNEQRRADFQIAETAIEVALGTPDDKHVQQVLSILEDSRSEVWLLVRSRRVSAWKDEMAAALTGNLAQRLVIASIEAFIGQNISELGSFSTQGRATQLRALFSIYNERVRALDAVNLNIVAR